MASGTGSSDADVPSLKARGHAAPRRAREDDEGSSDADDPSLKASGHAAPRRARDDAGSSDADPLGTEARHRRAARSIFGALLGRPAEDQISPWLYRQALEEYDSTPTAFMSLFANCFVDQVDLNSSRYSPMPFSLGSFSLGSLSRGRQEPMPSETWHRSCGGSTRYQQLGRFNDYKGDGLLVAFGHLVRGRDRANDSRLSTVQLLASPCVWKVVADTIGWKQKRDMAKGVQEATTWWRSTLPPPTRRTQLWWVQENYDPDTLHSHVGTHERRLQRLLEDLVSSVDEALGNSVVLIARVAPVEDDPLEDMKRACELDP